MRQKKSSLNLSVNAIVVFVLAFAMLGVGLFVTDLIRRNLEPSLQGAFEESDFKELPTSSRQLTYTTPSLTMQLNKEFKLGIAYYHSGKPTVNAYPGLLECRSSDPAITNEMINGPNGFIDNLQFITVPEEIQQGEYKIFSVIIKNVATTDVTDPSVKKRFLPGSYICKFCIFEDEYGYDDSGQMTGADGKLTRVYDYSSGDMMDHETTYYCEQKNIQINP